MFTTPRKHRHLAAAALAVAVAALGAGPASAEERSGSVSSTISPLQPITIDVPVTFCIELDGKEQCTADSATAGGTAFGGTLRLDWLANSGGNLKSGAGRCGSAEVAEGAWVSLYKTAGWVTATVSFTPTGASSPSSSQSKTLTGREIDINASVC